MALRNSGAWRFVSGHDPQMNSLTPEQAREYLARWKLVRQAECEELRKVSMETKLQQLAVLMASRGLFGRDPDRDTRVREIRDRWARIRQVLSD